MRFLGALLRAARRPLRGWEDDIEHGKPGPVLDADGRPATGTDGRPLQKVLVTIRRDRNGDPIEQAWVDPRHAWQWDGDQWG